MTLAGVPYYLLARVGGKRTGITPCWLHDSDAQRALGDSEFLEVASDRLSGYVSFDRIGFNTTGARERWTDLYYANKVERLVRRFHQLVAAG